MLPRRQAVATFACLNHRPVAGLDSPIHQPFLQSANLCSTAFGQSLSPSNDARKQSPFYQHPTTTRASAIFAMSSSDFSTGTNGVDFDTGSSLLSSAIPFMWNAMTIAVGLAAVVGGLLYAKQDSMLYYPSIGSIPRRTSENPRRYRSPDEHQIPFEQVFIRTSDGIKIHAWLMLKPQSTPQSLSSPPPRMPVIVFFHGNAGNIGLRLPNALQMLQYLDAHVLLVEYRGYGDSDDAQVNEAGLKLDSEAALRFAQAHPKIDPNQIFLFGRSLGGSVAFHLAMHAQQTGVPIAGVMVENTFLSIAAMVDALMPYVAPFKQLILRIGWRSDLIVPHLQMPVLYLAGAQDELVPHSHMQDLYKNTINSAYSKMYIIDNGTHNESWLQGGTEYWAQLKDFMKKASAFQPASAPIPTSPTTMKTNAEQVLPQAPHTVEKTTTQQDATNMGSPSIPIMPSRLLGMMSEAVSGDRTKKDEPAKKKEN